MGKIVSLGFGGIGFVALVWLLVSFMDVATANLNGSTSHAWNLFVMMKGGF